MNRDRVEFFNFQKKTFFFNCLLPDVQTPGKTKFLFSLYEYTHANEIYAILKFKWFILLDLVIEKINKKNYFIKI